MPVRPSPVLPVRPVRSLPVLSLLGALLLAGCGSGEDTSGCPAPERVARPGPLVAALGLQRLGVPVVAREDGELSTATVVSERSVGALLTPVTKALEAGGYDVLGTEDEGFEAEIYFARGTDTNGVARLTGDPDCDGRSRVQVSVATVGGGTATPSQSPTPS